MNNQKIRESRNLPRPTGHSPTLRLRHPIGPSRMMVDPTKDQIMAWVYELFAEGKSPAAIADLLNAMAERSLLGEQDSGGHR